MWNLKSQHPFLAAYGAGRLESSAVPKYSLYICITRVHNSQMVDLNE